MEAEFLRKLRKEMERAYHPDDAGKPVGQNLIGEPNSLEQSGIHVALASLYGSYALVGQLPAQPPTWRGRVGNTAVKLVKRMLFWYTPQIVRFQYSALRVFEEQAKALALASQRLRELERRQDEVRDSLESHIRQLNSELFDERARNDALHTELRDLQTSMASIASQIEASEPFQNARKEQPCVEKPNPVKAPHPDRSTS